MIGIVASRIAERHHRPAILIALDGGGGGQRLRPLDQAPSTCSAACDASAGTCSATAATRAAAGLTIARRGGRRPSAASSSSTPTRSFTTRTHAEGPGGRRRRRATRCRWISPRSCGSSRRSERQPSGVAARAGGDAGASRGRWGEGRHVAFHAERRRRPLALRRSSAPAAPCRSSPRGGPPTPPCGWRSTAGTARSRRSSSCAAPSACSPGPIKLIGESGTSSRPACCATGSRPPAARRVAARRRATRVPRPARHRDRRRARRSRRVAGECARRHAPTAASRRGLATRRRVRPLVVGGARATTPRSRPVRPRRRDRPTAHAHPRRCSTCAGRGWTHLAWGGA